MGAWEELRETAEEWLAAFKRSPGAAPFREPLTNLDITIDSDRLAHVRADFQVVRMPTHLCSQAV